MLAFCVGFFSKTNKRGIPEKIEDMPRKYLFSRRGNYKNL